MIEFFGTSKEKSSRAMVPSKFLLAFMTGIFYIGYFITHNSMKIKEN